MDEMMAAVQGLYTAFARVPRPEQVDRCTNCCISEEELVRLVEVSREELTAEELSAYASNAPDTVGAEEDFRYFLPRLLDLAAQGAFDWPDQPWVVRRLRLVPWRDEWSASERDAVCAYLHAWWRQTLRASPGEDRLDEVLGTLGEVGGEADLQHCLDLWLQEGREAHARLARFVLDHITNLALGKSWDVWATAGSARLVYRWLLSGPPALVLTDAFEQDPEAPEAELFLEAASLLVTR